MDSKARAEKANGSGLFQLGGIILGMGDNGSGQCLEYREGVPDDELEEFFRVDNERLQRKWAATGLVG